MPAEGQTILWSRQCAVGHPSRPRCDKMTRKGASMENLHAIESSIAGDLVTSDVGIMHLSTLADQFNGRAAGSSDEAGAASYIVRSALSYTGAPPVTRAFRYQGWQRGKEQLDVISPVKRQLPGVALPGAPSATVEAPLVSIGSGEPEDIDAAGSLEGRI